MITDFSPGRRGSVDYPTDYPKAPDEDYEKVLLHGVAKRDLDKLYNLIVSLHATTRKEAETTRFHVTVEMDRTRAQLTNIIKEGELTIIDCIKFNSAKNIQLISLMGIAVTSFSLLISFLLKINILNPFFAAVFLIASVGFWSMASLERKRS